MAVASPTIPPPTMAQSNGWLLIRGSPRLKCAKHLATMEAFGKASGRVGFDTAQTEQSEKEVFREPLLAPLCAKKAHQPLHLAFGHGFGKGHKEIWLAQIRIILGDFVFHNQVITEGIPGKFAKKPMILMKILAKVGKDEIGNKGAFEIFEGFFYGRADVGEKPVAKGFDDNTVIFNPAEERSSALFRLFGAVGIGTEDEPVDFQFRALPNEFKYRSAATDLNVVTVSAET